MKVEVSNPIDPIKNHIQFGLQRETHAIYGMQINITKNCNAINVLSHVFFKSSFIIVPLFSGDIVLGCWYLLLVGSFVSVCFCFSFLLEIVGFAPTLFSKCYLLFYSQSCPGLHKDISSHNSIGFHFLDGSHISQGLRGRFGSQLLHWLHF